MTQPSILLIDDDPQIGALESGATVTALVPGDANFSTDLVGAIAGADLILLDHNLHLPQQLSLSALDGASFVGHLRSYARAQDVSLPPLVIYTSEEEAFKDEVPAVGPAVPLVGSFVGRQARIAPTLDVEWLVAKDGDAGAQLALSLAEDSAALRVISGDGRMSLSETASFLKVPTDPAWCEIAHGSIARWRPPVSEPGASGPGPRGVSATLRWLLHQVLPFPGLLLSSEYASWSLGIELEDFIQAAHGGRGQLSEMLDAALYKGPGALLYDLRWWAAGIDFIGWQLRELACTKPSLQLALDEMANPGLRLLGPPERIVTVNSDLENAEIAPFEEAIEIHPPGWPPEALQLWMRRNEAAQDAVAKSMIDPSELSLLP